MAKEQVEAWGRTVSVDRPDGSVDRIHYVVLPPRELLESMCTTIAPGFARDERSGANAKMGHALAELLRASIGEDDHTLYCLAMIGFCELKRRHDEQQDEAGDPHNRVGRSD